MNIRQQKPEVQWHSVFEERKASQIKKQKPENDNDARMDGHS